MVKGHVHILKGVWATINHPLFTINNSPVSFLQIFYAIAIVAIGVILAKTYKRYIEKLSQKYKNFLPSSRIIIENIGYYTITVISLFIAIKSIGVDLTSLTVIAGALSVGVGFGLQTIVSNFVSGIILMFEKSIKIGDYIEISDTLRGRVQNMHMRSTVIKTNDNIDIIIPNQSIIQNNVINWTLSDNIRRFKIPFSVAYGSSIEKTKEAILNALNRSNLNFIKNDPGREPQVIMKAMNNSSVDFELYVWVKGEDITKPNRTASAFLELIYNALYESNIEIPFPQLDIHFKEELRISRD